MKRIIILIMLIALTGAIYAQKIIKGTGTQQASYIPLFISDSTVSNSVLFQSNGNIGIGTTSISEKLDLYQGKFRIWNGNHSAPLRFYSTGDTTHNNVSIDIWTKGYGGSEDLNFDINNYGGNIYWRGNSGVGMWNGAKLEITGAGALNKGGSNLLLYSNDTAYARIAASNGDTYFKRGNVGIGTPTPATNLELLGTTGLRIRDGLSGGQMNLWSDGTGQSHAQWGGSGKIEGQGGRFEIRSTSNNMWMDVPSLKSYQFNIAGVEKIKFDSLGRIGIGLPNPAYPLDVAGVMRSVVSGPSSTSFVLQNTSTAFNNSLFYGYTTRTGNTEFRLLDLRSNSGGTNAMWVDGIGNGYFAGNVGIGISASGAKLDVVNSQNNPSATIYGVKSTTSLNDETESYLEYGGYFLSNGLSVGKSFGIYAEANPTFSSTGTYSVYAKQNASNGYAIFANGGRNYFSGNVLISSSTSQTNSEYKLDVKGGIRADSVVVNISGADFVFDDQYDLSSLDEVEQYIKENKHLPGIQSAQEMQKEGVSVGNLQTKLLQKIEELTLHMIEQNKRIDAQVKENLDLKQSIEILKSKIQN